MKEFMIHVERIVRPVRAIASRKLVMRRELLAHLEAAMEEERTHDGNEAAAVRRAKLRLGDPLELTRTLQQTVPVWERILFAKLRMSRGFDTWEQQAANRLYGKPGPMTMGHISILSGMALLAGAPLLLPINRETIAGVTADHLTVAIVGALVAWPVLLLASYRFVFGAAGPDLRLDWRGTLRRGATILSLQIGLTFFAAFAIANHVATIGEVVKCATASVALLAASILIARRVGVLRRPYDEWLTLNIAE